MGILPEETKGETDMWRGNWRLSPGGPGKLIGKLGEGLSSDLNGLLESILTGLLASSMSLCALEPPLAAEGVQLEAESGLSWIGLECPLEGVPARSGEQSENLRPEMGVRSRAKALPEGVGDGAAVGCEACESPEVLFKFEALAALAAAAVRWW